MGGNSGIASMRPSATARTQDPDKEVGASSAFEEGPVCESVDRSAEWTMETARKSADDPPSEEAVSDLLPAISFFQISRGVIQVIAGIHKDQLTVLIA